MAENNLSQSIQNPNLQWCGVSIKYQDKFGRWIGLERKGWIPTRDYDAISVSWMAELKRRAAHDMQTT